MLPPLTLTHCEAVPLPPLPLPLTVGKPAVALSAPLPLPPTPDAVAPPPPVAEGTPDPVATVPLPHRAPPPLPDTQPLLLPLERAVLAAEGEAATDAEGTELLELAALRVGEAGLLVEAEGAGVCVTRGADGVAAPPVAVKSGEGEEKEELLTLGLYAAVAEAVKCTVSVALTPGLPDKRGLEEVVPHKLTTPVLQPLLLPPMGVALPLPLALAQGVADAVGEEENEERGETDPPPAPVGVVVPKDTVGAGDEVAVMEKKGAALPVPPLLPLPASEAVALLLREAELVPVPHKVAIDVPLPPWPATPPEEVPLWEPQAALLLARPDALPRAAVPDAHPLALAHPDPLRVGAADNETLTEPLELGEAPLELLPLALAHPVPAPTLQRLAVAHPSLREAAQLPLPLPRKLPLLPALPDPPPPRMLPVEAALSDPPAAEDPLRAAV